MATSPPRAALYGLDHDNGRTVKSQLQPLHEAARRLGWTVVAVCSATRASVAPRVSIGG